MLLDYVHTKAGLRLVRRCDCASYPSISFLSLLLRFSQPWLVLQLIRFQAGDFRFNGKSADAQISTGAWSALRNSTTCYSLQLISPFSVWSAMQWSSWVTGLLLR